MSNPNELSLYMMVRGKCTGEKIGTLFSLMSDIILDANLNNKKRVIEMLKESKVRKEASVISSGHTYAASRLAAQYSPLGEVLLFIA